MAVFVYSARSRSGEKVDGEVEANDRRAAMLAVERMGVVPINVQERSAVNAGPGARKRFHFSGVRRRMGMRDVLIFTTELSDLLASGMTLGNALNALARRKSGRPGDEIITSLRDEIVQGASLSEACARHPKVFSELYVSMLKAGEISGALAEVLERLVDHYERIQETKEKVVMALVYPSIVMTMGIATMVFSMIFVVPKFETLFSSLGETLPLPTRMLIGMSTWLRDYGILAGLVLAGGIVAANRAVQTKAGRRWLDGFKLRIPLAKGVVASGIYANFARTLGSLLRNGVPVLQALGIVEKTVGNVVIGAELKEARDRVTDGTTISGPLAAGGVLPPMMIDMLSIGEQTGDMPSALNHIARRYENELDRNIKIFTTALEPILIVLVAVMVGFVAISILLAVFSLTDGLSV